MPLELQMVRRVIDLRLDPPDAEAAVLDLRRMGDNVPPSRFVEADLRFHRSLAESIGSPRFSRLYRAIQGELHLSMVQSKPARGAELISSEHGSILEAIRRGDREKALDLMESHLKSTLKDITVHWLDRS
jgi:DNA-binding FadR family transcriptional regulator